MNTFDQIKHRFDELRQFGIVPMKFWIKAADDDAGKLQSSVFEKAVSASYLYIFVFSFQRKFNNHLKILTTTIWSTISRFYHCYFILRWNGFFSRFYFQLVNG